MSEGDQAPQPTPFERFERLAKTIARVPKKELDDKLKEKRAKKAKRPRPA